LFFLYYLSFLVALLTFYPSGANPCHLNHAGGFPLLSLILNKRVNKTILDATLKAAIDPIPNGVHRNKSLLSYACESNNIEIVRKMMPLLTTIDVTDGPTPALYSAATTGNILLVAMLLTVRREYSPLLGPSLTPNL